MINNLGPTPVVQASTTLSARVNSCRVRGPGVHRTPPSRPSRSMPARDKPLSVCHNWRCVRQLSPFGGEPGSSAFNEQPFQAPSPRELAKDAKRLLTEGVQRKPDINAPNTPSTALWAVLAGGEPFTGWFAGRTRHPQRGSHVRAFFSTAQYTVFFRRKVGRTAVIRGRCSLLVTSRKSPL